MQQQIQSTITQREFSVGICATGDVRSLEILLSRVLEERYPSPFILKKIIVVASGCLPESLAFARELSKTDKRLLLIEEDTRYGKAEAINRIIQNAVGEYFVFVNSDAMPERGSISLLLLAINKDPAIGIISGCPVFDKKRGLTSRLLQLMWLAHNECSRELNDASISNHSSDELMIARSGALHALPDGLVNDGAFMAGMAKRDGFLVKFCERSKVKIDVPASLFGLIRQRRRITYGHLQVWKLTGKAPRTIESLLLFSPWTSLSILVRTLAKHPDLIVALPLGAIEEVFASFLAVRDNFLSTRQHSVWKRYGS
ncbi:MAG: glycosyltransferase [Nitrososphaerales archaeon]